MNTLELREWAINNNIEKKTINSFWIYYNTFANEEPELFYKQFGKVDEHLVEVKIAKVGLTIVNWPDDYVNDCVITYADIKYKNEDIAEYKLIFNLLGEIRDDYLLLLSY